MLNQTLKDNLNELNNSTSDLDFGRIIRLLLMQSKIIKTLTRRSDFSYRFCHRGPMVNNKTPLQKD